MLSSSFHIHVILKLILIPLWKIRGNAFCAHFVQLDCKSEYSEPHFLFHNCNKDSASFQFWAALGSRQKVLNSCICQHCDVKTSTLTPTFY